MKLHFCDAELKLKAMYHRYHMSIPCEGGLDARYGFFMLEWVTVRRSVIDWINTSMKGNTINF